jgi:glyoxylase-like metal-dependent hydrolase (beta-lactamase superfamily II)
VGKLNVVNLYPGGFASNCYLVSKGRDAVLIDCSAPTEAVQKQLHEQGVRLHAILCTHGHFDHVLTADRVRADLGVPLYIHKTDAEMLTDSEKNAFSFFFGYRKAWQPAERLFEANDTLTFGALSLAVLHTPGHSGGSASLLCENALFTGDTLFAEGYGRTDLYGGDASELADSLQRLYRLPEHLMLYPGHGNEIQLKSLINK